MKANKFLDNHPLYLYLLAIFGIILSLYLVQEHYSNEKAVCDINSKLSCCIVNKSSYAILFNVPVAIFGVCWNIVQALLALKIWENEKKDLIWIYFMIFWCVLGMFFVVYLIYAEIMLQSLCPFCTVIHIIVVLDSVLAYHLYNSLNKKTTLSILLASSPNFKFWLAGIVLLFFVPLFYFNLPQRDLSEFAKCLRTNGVKMFGTNHCLYCNQQKRIFGNSFQYMRFIDCEVEQDECTQWNIESYPTFIQVDTKGKELKRESGLMSIEDLQEFSGCVETNNENMHRSFTKIRK